jgi:hypothetical protein
MVGHQSRKADHTILIFSSHHTNTLCQEMEGPLTPSIDSHKPNQGIIKDQYPLPLNTEILT